MPGILPMKIKKACVRCSSNGIHCDGARPNCSNCSNLSLPCVPSPKLSRRAFPRGYTESLEERVRSLEAEVRESQDLVEEKDERIERLSAVAGSTSLDDISTNPGGIETRDPIIEVFEITQNKEGGAGGSRDLWRRQTLQTRFNKQPLKPKATLQSLFYAQVETFLEPVAAALRLPHHILDTFGMVIFSRVCELSDLSENSRTYWLVYGFFSLAWTYFPDTRTCVGLLLLNGHNDETMKTQVLTNISNNQRLVGHPALLPLVAHKVISGVFTSWLVKHENEVIAAQTQMGYYHELALERHEGFVDFSQLSEKLSGIAMNLATNKLCWEALLGHVDFVIEETAELENMASQGSISSPELSNDKHIIAYAKQLRRDDILFLKEAESWQAKSQILLQGIFNLIAQRDQITNIELARDSRTLAEESKRDSTSMKSIAAVTMVFLPGTFAASVLAMPMFQWDASRREDIISKRFWVYPLVAIPITILTFVAWIAWIRYKNEHKEKVRKTDKTL